MSQVTLSHGRTGCPLRIDTRLNALSYDSVSRETDRQASCLPVGLAQLVERRDFDDVVDRPTREITESLR